MARITFMLVALISLFAAGCGDGDSASTVFGGAPAGSGADGDDAFSTDGSSDSSEDDLEAFAEALNEAQGAGGGGTLTFDGVDYPIESAICMLEGSRIDVGTVGSDYRVFVTGDPTDLDLQILDPDFLQWFDGDPTDATSDGKATIDGKTIRAENNSWWNNADDRVVEASFVIDCP